MSFYGYNPPAEPVSSVTLVPNVELGTRRTHGLIDYVYCYNSSNNSQISKGQIGFITTFSSGFSVSVTNLVSQAGGRLAVGVAHNATLITGAYGWLATRGPVNCSLDSGEASMSSGDPVAAGLNGGFVTAIVSANTDISQAAVLGVCINSCVTIVGTGRVWFKSPLFS